MKNDLGSWDGCKRTNSSETEGAFSSKDYRRNARILENARILHKEGRDDVAIAHAKTISETWGVGDRASILLGDIYSKKGMREEAILYYRKSNELNRHHFIAGTWYERASYAAFRDTNYDESEYWCRRALTYFINEKSVEEIARSHIKDVNAYRKLCIANACERLGEMYLIREKPARALSFLKAACQMRQSDRGMKRNLEKATQHSQGKEERDGILDLIPKELVLHTDHPPSTKEMLEEATERIEKAEIEMRKYSHWTRSRPQTPDSVEKLFGWMFAFDRNYSYHRPEIELMDGVWTDACSVVLEKVVKKWRWELRDHILDEIVRSLSRKEIARWKKEFKSHGFDWERSNDRIIVVSYAVMKAKELKLSYQLPQNRICEACGGNFFEGDIESFFAGYFDSPAEPLCYCPKCLCSAFLAGYKRSRNREEMKEDLKNSLKSSVSFLPRPICRFMEVHPY